MVGNWASIGPRRLDRGVAEDGTLVSTGGRMFITHAPIDGSVRLSVRKLDGRARTSVTACSWTWRGQAHELWDFEVPEGPELGEFTRTVSVSGDTVFIHLDNKSVAKEFKGAASDEHSSRRLRGIRWVPGRR